MAQAKEKFRLLLKEAIYAIHLHEEKSISLVHEELGRVVGKQPSAIEHWRKGNIPASYSDLEALAEEIIQRGHFDFSWLRQFLDAADYPYSDKLIDRLFPADPRNRIQPAGDRIIRLSPRKVIGREALLDRIVSVLQEQNGPWIVSLDGMGGIGKTALAAEVARQCLDEKLFETLVWVNALKREYPDAPQEESSVLTFEMALNAIGSQLGDDEVPRLRSEEKHKRIQFLLHQQRVLVVLDNLELAREPQNDVARRLLPLLPPSKALLISRHRFTSDSYAVRLTGLDEQSTHQLINREAAYRNIIRVEAAEASEFKQIAESTGGSPLALKLVVGQLAHLPLATVLKHLRAVRPLKSDTNQDDYIRFYKFIFTPSWHLLSHNSQRLLLAMTHFAPGVGGIVDMIQEGSALEEDELVHSIDQLWQMSFLEVGESSSLQRVRYFLHALTQHFVLSDVVQVLDSGRS
jgi:hypothetical protein